MTLLQRAALEGWSRPEEFFTLFTTLLKQDPFVAACIARTARPPDLATEPSPLSPADIAGLADNKLLHCMMISAPICDEALEHLLTCARRALLDLANSSVAEDASEAISGFCCALARQCFINEYVFHCDDEEEQQARTLRDRLTALMAAGETAPPLLIGSVATYFPLHSLQLTPGRFKRAGPDAVAHIVVQQVDEPATERSLRVSMPALTPIREGVSSLVREMYEENPYPRWVTALSLASALSFDEKMKLTFPLAAFDPLGKADVDILVAGCGTGRQAVEIARLYRGAKILAVDLSLASLAHAKRKSNELGLGDITFGQADILELGKPRTQLRRHRIGRCAAPSPRAPGGVARPHRAAAPGRVHEHRAVQRAGEAGSRGCARAHRRAGLQPQRFTTFGAFAGDLRSRTMRRRNHLHGLRTSSRRTVAGICSFTSRSTRPPSRRSRNSSPPTILRSSASTGPCAPNMPSVSRGPSHDRSRLLAR